MDAKLLEVLLHNDWIGKDAAQDIIDKFEGRGYCLDFTEGKLKLGDLCYYNEPGKIRWYDVTPEEILERYDEYCENDEYDEEEDGDNPW